LGARALYLGNTEYRIHGTNDPSTIGKHVSSGCIRLQNADIIDLYGRVGIGTKVVVLPNDQRRVSLDGGNGPGLNGVVLEQARSGRRSAQVPVPAAAQQGSIKADRAPLSGVY
jgi:hypothetical protein